MTFDELPPLNTGSLYSVLSVAANAMQADLRRAYRRKALLYHPDRHSDADHERAEAAFRLISEAYRVLSSPEGRAQYDRALANGETWHFEGSAPAPVSLAELLQGFEEFENPHEDRMFKGPMVPLEKMVKDTLLRDLNERVLEVWPLRKAPREASFKGSFHCGAVVLTNIRLLFPYMYKWTEVRGNTKTTYTGGNMMVCVLYLAKSMEIVEEGGIESATRIRILTDTYEINFRIRAANLLKLLIAARKWGIKVTAEADPDRDIRRVERRWMLRPVWWIVWLALLYLVVGTGWNLFLFDKSFTEARNGAISFANPGGIWAILALVAWWVYRLQRWILVRVPEGFVGSVNTKESNGIAAL